MILFLFLTEELEKLEDLFYKLAFQSRNLYVLQGNRKKCLDILKDDHIKNSDANGNKVS